jgi:ABC-type multidrug transport system ATPase subunit
MIGLCVWLTNRIFFFFFLFFDFFFLHHHHHHHQVADPDVLFLDEPTSGLDSTSSEIILAALKELSRLGRTIIMVIHQPRYSIFASMDNVIFLGAGGKTVYSGSPIDATDYFEMLGFYAPEGVNYADYFMDVIGGTIARANYPEFDTNELFKLWKEYVKYR